MATQKPKTKEQRRARRKVLERKPRYRAEVVAGVEGMALYINGYRVAGPKPWGGGIIRNVFEFDENDLKEAQAMPLPTDGEVKP